MVVPGNRMVQDVMERWRHEFNARRLRAEMQKGKQSHTT
jgi:hypothetical protein